MADCMAALTHPLITPWVSVLTKYIDQALLNDLTSDSCLKAQSHNFIPSRTV